MPRPDQPCQANVGFGPAHLTRAQHGSFLSVFFLFFFRFSWLAAVDLHEYPRPTVQDLSFCRRRRRRTSTPFHDLDERYLRGSRELRRRCSLGQARLVHTHQRVQARHSTPHFIRTTICITT
ncbi:hypothetical protein FA13DRAFT_1279540 [Coprinellus micaceus]|uniref:Uncharacterized protein n=1 Tax=Coprinellus micaceus TaxID=71717 RepID=A0A4Y7SUA2_COPMI|nr:hypothetical protein FA13DRAFT_1279540 [Coprinellus micaceus]